MPSVVTDFVDLLAQTELLNPVQLHELAAWQEQYEELDDLVRELLHRGWLTTYQVDRLNDSDVAHLVIGPYVLLEEIGQGGMGRVYKARHRRLDRIVALKVINPSDLSHPEAVRRFQREAKAIARLRHPNIVLLYDADESNGLHFLALEYVQGVDLEKLLVQKGPLPLAQACDCIRQAAFGLQHAFERGLVHRDIKPANLLLTRDTGDGAVPVEKCSSAAGGVVKILDLGLARFSNIRAEVEKLSIDGIVVGTPDYLAPEQALDSSKVDIRADIYSLGCTFYELLTGQTPFAAVQGTQKLIAHIQEDPPGLGTLRAGLPMELIQVVNKMMAKNPVERFQSPAEVAEVLEDLSDLLGEGGEVIERRPRLRATPLKPAVSGERTGVIRFKHMKGESPRPPGLFTEQPRQLPEHTAPVYAVSFSLDGRYALSAGEDRGICLWDMNAVRKVRRFLGHTDRVLALAFTPDGRQALSSSRDRSVILWDVETGLQVQRLKGATGETLCLAFSPDGKSILTGGQDMSLTLWDRLSLKMIRQCGGLVRNRHFGPITAVRFTPDSSRAVSCSVDGSVRMWNLKTGGELHCFNAHKDGVAALALSPDGLHLLSGGADKSVRTWGMLSGEELSHGTGHMSAIRGVAFLPDGLHTVSADENTIRAWELTTGREVFRSRDDAQKILCMAVSPDGRQVLTGGKDKFLCLWKRND